jgi:hypothetical protein
MSRGSRSKRSAQVWGDSFNPPVESGPTRLGGCLAMMCFQRRSEATLAPTVSRPNSLTRGRPWPGAFVLVALLAACGSPSVPSPPASAAALSVSRSAAPSVSSPAGSTSVPSPATQSLAPELAQRWLAFSRGKQEVSSDKSVSRADGSDRRQLTHRAGFLINPVWSPDGNRILYRADLAIGSAPDLKRDGSGVPATWTPGQLLAFNCSLGGDAIGICARGTDGGFIQLLGGLDAGFQSWKPR